MAANFPFMAPTLRPTVAECDRSNRRLACADSLLGEFHHPLQQTRKSPAQKDRTRTDNCSVEKRAVSSKKPLGLHSQLAGKSARRSPSVRRRPVFPRVSVHVSKFRPYVSRGCAIRLILLSHAFLVEAVREFAPNRHKRCDAWRTLRWKLAWKHLSAGSNR